MRSRGDAHPADRQGSVPRAEPTYLALADELQAQLATLSPGDRLPSEHALVAGRGVSRLTARAALDELESRMLVRRVRGAGTFVARRVDYPIGPAMSPSASEMIRRAGGHPTNRLVSVRTRKPLADVRDALELDSDERVVAVTRAGQIDGLPAWFGTSHLPLDLVEDLPEHLSDGVSIYTTLRDHFGIALSRCWTRAELAVVPADVAPHLSVEGRPLVWRLETCSRDRSVGRPVELAQSWLRVDMYRVRFELGEAD
jgi:DNA-binding GntR family transcriptional regulator